MRYGTRWFFATAVFISPTVLLTAASNVWNEGLGGAADEVRVIPYYGPGGSAPLGRYEGRASVNLTWRRTYDFRFNWALVIIDYPIGSRVGMSYFASEQTDRMLSGVSFRSLGHQTAGGQLRLRGALIDRITDYFLHVEGQSTGGESGSGLRYQGGSIFRFGPQIGLLSHRTTIRDRVHSTYLRTDGAFGRLYGHAAALVRPDGVDLAMVDAGFAGEIDLYDQVGSDPTPIEVFVNLWQGGETTFRGRPLIRYSLRATADGAEYVIATKQHGVLTLPYGSFQYIQTNLPADLRNVPPGCYRLIAEIVNAGDANSRNNRQHENALLSSSVSCFDPAPYCSGTMIYTGRAGSFTDGSPDNTPYNQGADCRFIIAPDEVAVDVTFDRFDLWRTGSFLNMTILRADGSEDYLQTFRHFDHPGDLLIHLPVGDRLALRFRTAREDRQGRGFRISYRPSTDLTAPRATFTVSPVPATERLTIRPPQNLEGLHTYTLHDALGRQLRAEPLLSVVPTTVPLSGFPAGVYYLRVIDPVGRPIHTQLITINS